MQCLGSVDPGVVAMQHQSSDSQKKLLWWLLQPSVVGHAWRGVVDKKEGGVIIKWTAYTLKDG